MRARLVAVGAVLGAVLVAGTDVGAQSPPARRSVRLRFERAAGLETCLDEAQLRDGVALRLGYDPFVAQAEREVRVALRRADRDALAHVELRDERDRVLGTRDLRGDASRCQELTSAVTLAISIAIDPVRASAPAASSVASSAPLASSTPSLPASSAPAPAASRPPAEPVASAAPSAAVPAPTLAPTPPRPWQEGLTIGVGVATQGAVASLAPEVRAGLVVDAGPGAFGVEGRVVLPSRRDALNGRIETSLIGASPYACLGWSLRLCIPVFVGALRGSSVGIEQPLSQTTFFASVGLRAQARRQVGPFWFALQVTPDVTLTRTTFSFGPNTAWKTPLVGLGVGLEVQWMLF